LCDLVGQDLVDGINKIFNVRLLKGNTKISCSPALTRKLLPFTLTVIGTLHVDLCNLVGQDLFDVQDFLTATMLRLNVKKGMPYVGTRAVVHIE
jgi:hypothetical protein